jgi:hypothetical protein
MNILGENTNIIKRNTEAFLDICRKIGVEVNTEKTKYMVMSCHQDAGQNHNLLTDNKSLKMWQAGEDCIMRSCITCMLHKILLGWPSQGGWMGWACSMRGSNGNAYKILVRKREGKRPLGR